MNAQNTTFQEMLGDIDVITSEFLRQELLPDVGQVCSCGCGERRQVMCEDCADSTPTCTSCFVTEHSRNPFHWARLWDEDRGFAKRMDISGLKPGGYAIPIGHSGERCPFRRTNPSEPIIGTSFIVLAENGVHNTLVEFCDCIGAQPHKVQLLRSRLFPATIKDPKMAFTFSLLRAYRIHSFESKGSAHDYLGALQRLTNNARPSTVSVSALQNYK